MFSTWGTLPTTSCPPSISCSVSHTLLSIILCNKEPASSLLSTCTTCVPLKLIPGSKSCPNCLPIISLPSQLSVSSVSLIWPPHVPCLDWSLPSSKLLALSCDGRIIQCWESLINVLVWSFMTWSVILRRDQMRDYVDNGQPGCRPVMGRRLYSVQCVQHHLMCTTSSHISHLVDLNTPARPSRAMPVLSTI